MNRTHGLIPSASLKISPGNRKTPIREFHVSLLSKEKCLLQYMYKKYSARSSTLSLNIFGQLNAQAFCKILEPPCKCQSDQTTVLEEEPRRIFKKRNFHTRGLKVEVFYMNILTSTLIARQFINIQYLICRISLFLPYYHSKLDTNITYINI